jgi:hypothetical protein
MSARPQKIAFAQMRASGVRGEVIYCTDYKCSHSIAISGDAWPDDADYPTLSRGLCARLVASVAPACGRTSTGKRSRSA